MVVAVRLREREGGGGGGDLRTVHPHIFTVHPHIFFWYFWGYPGTPLLEDFLEWAFC